MIWSCCGPRRRSSVISLRGAAGARFLVLYPIFRFAPQPRLSVLILI